MNLFRFTLLLGGSSDKALISHLTCLLRQNGLAQPIDSEWADLSRVVRKKPKNLTEKIERSIELYPCDIHRDAEKENPDNRREEIVNALFSTYCKLKNTFYMRHSCKDARSMIII